MARIKDSSVEAVKAAADIVSVVEDRTSLRKQGARLVGRCPFHEERTPSFSVNPGQGLYYCFGCGAKGDLITFVRETEGLDFAGSIEWLAERFRVPIEYEESSPQQDAARQRRLRLLSLRAFMFDHVYLGPVTRPEHERAREVIGRIFRSGAPVEFIAGMTDRFALSYADRLA